MKRSIVRPIIFLAILVPSLAAAALAQDGPTCSSARVAGEWGHTITGTLILPTGAAPFAAVGRFTLGADGDFAGTQDSSLGGGGSKDILKGTLTVNPDCTGTLTVDIYDESGSLLRTANWSLVFDDNARELRSIITSLVLPNGAKVPSIVTAEARRLFPNRDK